MNYKILSTKQVEDMIFTEVEYDTGSEKVTVSIPHFRPKTVADVELGIANRAISESAKLDAKVVCEQILPMIEKGKIVDIGAVGAVAKEL